MKTINEQINPNIVIRAQKLARLTAHVHSVLPAECHSHVSVGGIRDRNLMLITDSPVWTTRLRQLSPKILQHIRDNTPKEQAMQAILHVQISTRYHGVDTSEQKDNKQQREKPQLSEKSARLLAQSAESIEHSKLKTALLKLASHSKSSNTDK